jgi:hypothetical protein
MFKPTEDEILRKAKQLCHEDGKLWSPADLEDPVAERTDPVVDESSRAEYLNRARETLQRRGPDL